MRKIDEIAAQQFGGDTYAAIDYYMQNEISIDEFVDEFTKEEAQHAFSAIVNRAAESYGGKDNLQECIIFEMKLQQLGLSEEEFSCATTNPFKKAAAKDAILLLLAIVVPLVVYLIARVYTKDVAWIFAVQSCLIGVCSLKFSAELLNMCRFRRLKKKQPKIDAIKALEKRNDKK